jgi:hypothetical protein
LALKSETPNADRGARRPDIFLTHLGKALLESILHPLAIVGRCAVFSEDVMVVLSYMAHPPTPSFFIVVLKCSSPAPVTMNLPGPPSGDELVQVVVRTISW